MSTATDYNIGELLEQAGAHPRGNRHDCPTCGGVRTVTHSDEAFFCHKCQWKGNAITLAKELGLYQQLSPEEYRELQRSREQADCAARALYGRVKARRSELIEQLRNLGRIERGAHTAPAHPLTWNALALVCGRRPELLAELAILENCRVVHLLWFLSANQAMQERAINKVIQRGGLHVQAGGFVEVEA